MKKGSFSKNPSRVRVLLITVFVVKKKMKKRHENIWSVIVRTLLLHPHSRENGRIRHDGGEVR